MAKMPTHILFALCLAAFGASGAISAPSVPRHHAVVDLISEKPAVAPGETITLAVRERLEPGWHVYWANPGDSGEPTAVEWKLPEGVTAGPILWPIPHTIPIGPLVNFGYENEALFLTEMQVPKGLNASDVTFSGKVNYLICKDICVPEEEAVEITLAVSQAPAPADPTSPIAAARSLLPRPLRGKATYSVNPSRNALRLAIDMEPNLLAGVSDVHFFPLTWGAVSNSGGQTRKVQGGQLLMDLQQGDTRETPAILEGVVVLTATDGTRTGYTVGASRGPDSASAGSLSNGDVAGAGSSSSPTAAASAASGTGIAVLFAFLGGVILNLMPCVFPVLALKALSFATGGGHRRQGMAYLAGVLVSFAGLAVFLAGLREGTSALGWGFQFQSPTFVLVLAVLFFVMGLSLSGAVAFGGSLMSMGDGLTRKAGNAGYFFTGMLAAIAATPCTAPFMGTAVGYALTQPTAVLLAVMAALGVGFALPVVLLGFSPALQRFLPRPGAWMETLKQILAFPLYATTAWLVWVLSIQTGSDGVMSAAVAIVGVGFAAWLSSKFAFASLPARIVAPTLGAVTLAMALSLIAAPSDDGRVMGADVALLHEEPFTQARLEQLTTEGRPVFVNLTAAWCITCKVNERIALKSAAVAQAFQAGGIVYLKGDWTKGNPEISALLERFGRAGVPLYLFYPSRGGGEPRVLPQLLTAGVVLDEIKSRSASVVSRSTKGA